MYDTWIKNFINNINCNLIIVTSTDLNDYFKEIINNRPNIYVILKNLEDLEIYKKYINIWDYQHSIDKQKDIRTKYCYIIWNSKVNFMKEAIELNYFNSDKFVWTDIGCIREQYLINMLNTFPVYDNISNNKIDITLLNQIKDTEQKYFQDEIYIAGCIYGSSKDNILKFHKLFYDKLDENIKLNKFIGCEQQTIMSICLENIDLFNMLNPHINNNTENNRFIEYISMNAWLYMCHYYSVQNKIIFRPNGRLGNAIFRYIATALLCIKNNYKYDYIIENSSNISDTYTFYKNMDHIGDDISRLSINNRMHHIDNNDMVVGFNTLGYIKSKIDVNNLSKSKYMNNNDGIFVKKFINVTDNNYFDILNKDLNKKFKNYNILMNGFFQFDKIYLENKKDIMSFIEKNKDIHYIKGDDGKLFLMKNIVDDIKLQIEQYYDIVIHIRLGDFCDKDDFIHYKYLIELFNNIENELSISKNAIVIEKPNNDYDIDYLNKCLEWFKMKNIRVSVESNDLSTDFNILKSAKTLVCCMSTLSWIAAYLSKNLNKCYMPDYDFTEIGRLTTFKKPIDNTIFYNIKNENINININDSPEKKKK